MRRTPQAVHSFRNPLALASVAGLAATSRIVMPSATATVTGFPDNVVVFPDRDFVSVECYTDHGGETATLEVSPPGDVVTTFTDGTRDETTTSSATVTKDMALDGLIVTVEGTVGQDVNPAQMERRIINPDLVDLVDLVGRRDARAIPGPLTPAPKGGYSSSLEFPAEAGGGGGSPCCSIRTVPCGRRS